MKALAAFLGLALFGLFLGCDNTPTGPTRFRPAAGEVVIASPVPTISVSGRLWRHDSSGSRLFAGGVVGGWLELPGGLGGVGQALSESDGTFRLWIPANGVAYLSAGDFHPCAVRVAAIDAASAPADVHVVTDPARLGASLPPDLPQRSPKLSGRVYETMEDGRQVPVAGARLAIDRFGEGTIIATTLTDEDGRYVFCGLDGSPEPSLLATQEGYVGFGERVRVEGDTVRDVELRRYPRLASP